MAAQVNVRLGIEDDADLSRYAAKRGIERTTLAKEMLREGMAACRDGRAMFDRPAELGPGDVVAMKAMLDRGLMEIDRIADAWAAHETTVHKLEREDQLALQRARTEFIAGMPERITASLNPIRAEMAAMIERIDNQPRLDAIDSKLDEVLVEARRPKLVTVYNIGLGDWSRGVLLAAALLLVSVGTLAFALLATILPERWLALPAADRVLGDGDRAICRLIDYQYDTGVLNCRTAVKGGTVTVTASRLRDGKR